MVLIALWSPKGGSGTSVFAAACAVVLARRAPASGVLLADLDGDQPAIFGLAGDPPRGLVDWLAAGPTAPTEALEHLAVACGTDIKLLPKGSDALLAPVPAAEAGAALAVALRDSVSPTIVDCACAATPATRAVVEVADASVVVLRACYLALRRAVHSSALRSSVGVVLVEEPGRSLSTREVVDVLDRPVITRVPLRPAIARVVDAGVVGTRLPDALARAADELFAHLDTSSVTAQGSPV